MPKTEYHYSKHPCTMTLRTNWIILERVVTLINYKEKQEVHAIKYKLRLQSIFVNGSLLLASALTGKNHFPAVMWFDNSEGRFIDSYWLGWKAELWRAKNALKWNNWWTRKEAKDDTGRYGEEAYKE